MIRSGSFDFWLRKNKYGRSTFKFNVSILIRHPQETNIHFFGFEIIDTLFPLKRTSSLREKGNREENVKLVK